MAHSRWIELDGVVNMRDLAGLPTADGRAIAPRRLIRSDNLQDLSEEAVAHLVQELGVSDVIDLRSRVEHELTGPGPLREAGLAHHHHSLVVEDQDDQATVDAALALKWQPADGSEPVRDADFWRRHYTGYVTRRPDAVSAALRAVADAEGAAVVHCAAGKDRTGTVIAIALAVAGVPEEEIVADYVLSAERIEDIIGRLIDVEPYRRTLPSHTVDEQRPQAASMAAVLEHLRTEHGGAAGWLRDQGWSEADITRLRERLLA